MKIYILINSLSAGGAEKVISLLLPELQKHNFKVEIVCLEKNNFYKIPENFKITYLSNFNGNENHIIKLLFLPIFAWKLKKYVKKNNIAMVQSHLYRANYVNILAKLFGSKHKSQIVNAGQISKYKNENILGKINLILIKHLYPKADLIILKSLGMQQDMQHIFNFKNKQIVINNPYDISTIEKKSKEKIENFEFKKDKKYICTVGRLVKWKRKDILIKSIKYVENEIENLELIIIGSGGEKQNLIKLSEKLNIDRKIHFLGILENPFAYVAKCNLFVLSSDDGEGFPNVLVEAMICKTPVISTDCKSGPREILAPGTDISYQLKKDIELAEYGILVPVGDSESLAKAIIKLLKNENLSKEYVNKAYKRAQDFNLDKIFEEYKKVMFYE